MISMVAINNQIENSKAFSFSATGKLAGDYDIQLIGHFNQENAVAAGLACLRLGASLEDIKKGIACNPRSWSYGSPHSEKRRPRFSSTMPTMGMSLKNSSMWLKLIKLERLLWFLVRQETREKVVVRTLASSSINILRFKSF